MTWSIPYNRIAIPARIRDIAYALAAARQDGTVLERALSAALRRRLDRSFTTFHPSARYALTAYLRTLPPRNREVLIPAFGCTILIDSILSAGLKPVLIDIELARYGLDPNALRRRIVGAAAVVAVHEFGIPFDASIPAIVRAHGVPLVEDLAVAFGAARGDGSSVGGEGDVTLLSGGLGKPFSAARIGVLMSDDEVAVGERRPAGLGISSAFAVLAGRVLGLGPIFAAFWRLLGLEAGKEELFVAAALTERPYRFDIALLLRLLDGYDGHIANRRDAADLLMASFSEFGWRGPAFEEDEPVFGRIPLLLPPGTIRERMIASFRQHGIDLSVPGRRSLIDRVPGTNPADLPNTILAQENCVALTLRPDFGDRHDLVRRAQAALRQGDGRPASLSERS